MSLRSDCTEIVPAPLLPLVPSRFDVIGDIAVLTLPEPLLPFSAAISRVIVSRRKNICTVARKVTKVEGDHRVARFELIMGTGTKTLHREFGFTYKIDIEKTFFAPRLATERRRVTDLVLPGEHVLIPFAGVGPFAIPAAAKGGIVTAIEWNNTAFRYLQKNVIANRVSEQISLVHGDAFDRSLLPAVIYERMIIPTPYGQDKILGFLSPVLKGGGEIHFYTFRKRHEIPVLAEQYERMGLSVLAVRRCGNIAPGVNRWVFDLKKECRH